MAGKSRQPELEEAAIMARYGGSAHPANTLRADIFVSLQHGRWSPPRRDQPASEQGGCRIAAAFSGYSGFTAPPQTASMPRGDIYCSTSARLAGICLQRSTPMAPAWGGI